MPVIEVEHLTKEYRLGALQSLKQTVMNTGARLMGRPVQERPLFKALDDINFSVERGEVVGIIGHNGAGKSTLLKMLARISTPTRGSVKVTGRVAPLIEVGAGFVPDFTGRENVYLNGAILGMPKKEIDRKFDEIVDFAEMAEFIDTPVKRYSSGMQVKLAFAVATSIESEILIVDEVLAVGDLAFQRKCFDRMEVLIRKEGRTVLLVSHNIRQVQRLCNRALMFDHGRISASGPAQEVCDAFYEYSDRKITANIGTVKGNFTSSGEADLESVRIINKDGNYSESLSYAEPFTIRFEVRSHSELDQVTFGFGFHTTDFLYLTTHNSESQLKQLSLSPGLHTIDCKVNTLPLLPGVYSLRFGLTAGKSARTVLYGENLVHFQVEGKIPLTVRDGFFALEAEWQAPTQSILPSHNAPRQIVKP